MSIKIILATAMASVIAFFVPPNISICIIAGILCFIAFKYYSMLSEINKFIDSVKPDGSTEESSEIQAEKDAYKKMASDIKTLYQNQRMLLSLVNAVRIRINNFYAKKFKEPKLKSRGFESSPAIGED